MSRHTAKITTSIEDPLRFPNEIAGFNEAFCRHLFRVLKEANDTNRIYLGEPRGPYQSVDLQPGIQTIAVYLCNQIMVSVNIDTKQGIEKLLCEAEGFLKKL